MVGATVLCKRMHNNITDSFILRLLRNGVINRSSVNEMHRDKAPWAGFSENEMRRRKVTVKLFWQCSGSFCCKRHWGISGLSEDFLPVW